MLAGGTVSNCFDLTPHDELVASFFIWLAHALGYVHGSSNFLESGNILWNQKSRDDSRAVLLLLLLFWKEEAQCENRAHRKQIKRK